MARNKRTPKVWIDGRETDVISLSDAARELLAHLEEFCEFPQNLQERKLSNQLYAAIAIAEHNS